MKYLGFDKMYKGKYPGKPLKVLWYDETGIGMTPTIKELIKEFDTNHSPGAFHAWCYADKVEKEPQYFTPDFEMIPTKGHFYEKLYKVYNCGYDSYKDYYAVIEYASETEDERNARIKIEKEKALKYLNSKLKKLQKEEAKIIKQINTLKQ